jgi:hypothetical protein
MCWEKALDREEAAPAMSISMDRSSTEDHGTTSGLRRLEGVLLYAPHEEAVNERRPADYVAARCAMMMRASRMAYSLIGRCFYGSTIACSA